MGEAGRGRVEDRRRREGGRRRFSCSGAGAAAMVMYTLVCYVLDASRYISKCVCKLFPSSRVRHLYQKTNLTKRLVQLGGAQAGLKHWEKAVPDT